MRGHGNPRTSAGMTLIEMLVVLMIAGMALALGYQSLSQWRVAETTLAGLSIELREQRLAQAWFEESVRAIVPVEDEPFAGSASTLSGITLAPPTATPGGTTRIEWSLAGSATGTTLDLESEGNPQLSLPLARARAGRLEYLDDEGRTYTQWPPALGLHDHLPAAVALVVERQDGATDVWVAAIAGRRNPPPIPPMFEAERD